MTEPPAADLPDEGGPPAAEGLDDGAAPSSLEGAYCGVHEGVAASFVCARCGTFGCAPCCFGGTGDHQVCRACARGALPEPIPWERRKELGWRRAYWETTKAVIKTPTQFYRTPSIEPGVLWPMLYGVVAKTVGTLLYTGLFSLLFMIAGVAVGVTTDGPEAAFLGGYFGCLGIGMLPMTLLQAPVGALMGILMATSLTHVTLVLFKSGKNGFEATMRAMSYANAPYIFLGIPCVGVLLPIVWVPWIEIISVREHQKVSTDKAVLAVLGWRLLIVVGIVGFYALLIAMVLMSEQSRL